MGDRKFSYAQNFEDIYIFKIRKMLIQNFPRISFPKTFIDIGAHHPQIDSVSKYFIDDGWNGVLVEPNPHFYDLLVREYFRNPNIKLINEVITGNSGELRKLYIPEITTGHASLVEGRLSILPEKYYSINKRSKSIDDLFGLFEEDLFFVKLDVEGSELEIISGWNRDNTVHLFIIEGPTDQIIALLQQKKFELIFFDGINGYFLNRTFSCKVKVLPINVVEDTDWVTPSGWLSRAANEELLALKSIIETGVMHD